MENTRSEQKNTILDSDLASKWNILEPIIAYKWNIIEYPRKYEIIFVFGPPPGISRFVFST